MEIKIPYYEDSSRISNSALGWFINNGPSYLRDKLNGKIPDETSNAMSRGTMIHEYVLQPDKFVEDYEVQDIVMPQSDNQKKFCRLVANSTEIEPNKRVLSAYKESYKTTGQSDEKTLLKATEMASTLNSYIKSLQSNKIYISSKQMLELDTILNNVKEHKSAWNLLYPSDNKIDWYHEFHINWEWNGIPCKSLLDCLTIDWDKKIVNVVDIKTTVNLYHFEDSIKKYDYLRQLKFYEMAVRWLLTDEYKLDPNEFTFNHYFIAVDTVKNNEVRVFKIQESNFGIKNTPNFVQTRIENALEAIKWHIDHNKWDHSVAYYTGTGSEYINGNLII